MKTNRSARWLVRIRGIMICLALVGMAGVAFRFGEFLSMRVAQPTAPQTQGPQAPNVNFANLIASAR